MNSDARLKAVMKAIYDDEFQIPTRVCERIASCALTAIDEAEASELVAVRSALRSEVEKLTQQAQTEPLGVDVSDFGDEWVAGFLRGQVNALEEVAALDGLSETPEGAREG